MRSFLFIISAACLLPLESNAQTLQWDSRLSDLGIVHQQASPSPGTFYWRLIQAQLDDTSGRVVIEMKCLTENDVPIEGQTIWMSWNGGSSSAQTKGQVDGYWGNIPMSGGNWCPPTPPGPFTGYVDGVSDRVVGMGLPCNLHYSYSLTFKRTLAGGQVTPTAPPSPTPTTPGVPTATPVGGQGGPRWKMEYARQYGEFLTGGVAGQSELFAVNQNGSFARAGMTNDANSNTAIFGYTDPSSPFTPGNVRVVFDTNNSVYDFRVYDPPTLSDRSPNCYWITPGMPHYGHYKFEFWFRKVDNESGYEFFPTQPVYHYDLVNGFNTASPPADAPNFNSDAFGLTNWTNEHWQTFVVPSNINRITAAKAFAVRQEGEKFRMTFSIHQGGINGPQVGPSVTSREKSSNEFSNVMVAWGLDDVPVTPGGAYAMKVTTSGGFNMYATNNNNYTQGALYNGTTEVTGRDMIAVITGIRKLAVSATSTPTPSSTQTTVPSSTSTPTSTHPPRPVGVFNYFDLFGFALQWYNNINETSYFETGYDLIPDGDINVNDLLRVFDTWHKAPPTLTPVPPTSTPSSTLTPTITPTPTITQSPTITPTPQDTQLLQNPSFELPANGAGQNPTGWIDMTTQQDKGNQGIVNSPQYGDVDPHPVTYPDGVQVARAHVTSYGTMTSPHGWYQQVPVVSGRTYTISGYLWTSSQGTNPTVPQGRIGVDVGGASANVGTVDVWCAPQGQSPPADGWLSSEMQWTQLSNTFITGANMATIYIDSRNQSAIVWSGVHFDLVEVMGAPPAPPTPTHTPVPGNPTSTPAPATPTPTQSGSEVFRVSFEGFRDIVWGVGLDYAMPLSNPSDPNTYAWPKHDGGDWANIDFESSSDSISGMSSRIVLKNISGQGIRGAGFEYYFRGATALVPNKQHTASVWAKSDYAGAPEYSDLVIGHAKGSGYGDIIQSYQKYDSHKNEAGWLKASLTFTSNSDTSDGDRIVIIFAGATTRATYSAVFDDLVITQDVP